MLIAVPYRKGCQTQSGDQWDGHHAEFQRWDKCDKQE